VWRNELTMMQLFDAMIRRCYTKYPSDIEIQEPATKFNEIHELRVGSEYVLCISL